MFLLSEHFDSDTGLKVITSKMNEENKDTAGMPEQAPAEEGTAPEAPATPAEGEEKSAEGQM